MDLDHALHEVRPFFISSDVGQLTEFKKFARRLQQGAAPHSGILSALERLKVVLKDGMKKEVY